MTRVKAEYSLDRIHKVAATRKRGGLPGIADFSAA